MPDTATEREAPKRLRAADVIDNLQRTIEALTTRTTEPWVTVEITDAAKGEVRVETKVSAPMGCDLEGLRKHAAAVSALATAQHNGNGARRKPDFEDDPADKKPGMKRPA